MNSFVSSLTRQPGQPPATGIWLMSASPMMAEAAGCAGFQWGVVDMEHAPLDLAHVVHLLQACSITPMHPIVRVPWNDKVMLKRVLDAGAQTVLVPFVQSAAEAEQAVAATRYPGLGVRGVAGMSRASRFGTDASYLTTANQRVGVILQLETPEAIDQLEAIAAVDGVDALFIGPADLSAAMGYLGNAMHPEVLELTAQAVRRLNALGKPVGTVGPTVAVVEQYLAMGFDFVALGSDLSLFMREAQQGIAALRGAHHASNVTGGY